MAAVNCDGIPEGCGYCWDGPCRRPDLPSILDADAPNLMINDDGDRFFPDGPEDAAYFAEHHGARPVHTQHAAVLEVDG